MYLDCLANGFRILSESSSDSKVDYGDFPPSVPSVWHCVELCRLYADCVWISWERSADDQEDSRKHQMKPIKIFAINVITAGTCKMMQEMPKTAVPGTSSMIDLHWISSSTNCTTVAQHFESKTKKRPIIALSLDNIDFFLRILDQGWPLQLHLPNQQQHF